MIDVERAGLEVSDNAVRPQTDLFHFLRAGQAGGDHLAFGGERRHRIGPGGAGSEQRVGRSPADIVNDEPVPGPQQLAGDRRADISDPDKPDFHKLSLSTADPLSFAGAELIPVPGFVPGIHVFYAMVRNKTWLAGTSPATGGTYSA